MLEHLGLVGVSWRQGGSEALGEFALQQEHAAAQLQGFAQRLQLAELAYLATCNRVELHFRAQRPHAGAGPAARCVSIADGPRRRARRSRAALARVAGRRRRGALVPDDGRARLGLRRRDRDRRPGPLLPGAQSRAGSLRPELGARLRGGPAHRRARPRRHSARRRPRLARGDCRAALARAHRTHARAHRPHRRLADDGACGRLARASGARFHGRQPQRRQSGGARCTVRRAALEPRGRSAASRRPSKHS